MLDKVEQATAKAKDKEDKIEALYFQKQNKKRLKFNELEVKGVEKFKKQNDVAGQVLKKLNNKMRIFYVIRNY